MTNVLMSIQAALCFEPAVTGKIATYLEKNGSRVSLKGLLEWANVPSDRIETLIRIIERTAGDSKWNRLPDGVRFVDCLDEEYPDVLRQVPNRPVGLWVAGDGNLRGLTCGNNPVSLLGTRDLSSYGASVTRALIEHIAQNRPGTTIVEGFAMGISRVAIERALDEGLHVIAVSGCGIDSVYPAFMKNVWDRLVKTPGCACVTPFPPASPPMAYNFVQRNHVIAGLCGIAVAVESLKHGGAVVTARLAQDYGRIVLAVPGNIDSHRCDGTNGLIRSGVAKPLTSVYDLF